MTEDTTTTKPSAPELPRQHTTIWLKNGTVLELTGEETDDELKGLGLAWWTIPEDAERLSGKGQP